MNSRSMDPEHIYGAETEAARSCYRRTEALFRESFGQEPVAYYRAPGRVELGGNHTDHQGGITLSASLTLDMIGAAGPRQDGMIYFQSEGYPLLKCHWQDAVLKEEEKGSSLALLRGMLAAFESRGYLPRTGFGGLNTALISRVPTGSGLSSSAALEILLACIFNDCFEAGLPPLELARMAQETERNYFGKPCGLLDQLSSVWGGVISVDFSEPEPRIRRLWTDLAQTGYQLFMVFCGAGHDNLTDAYAAIPAECGAVAAFFGEKQLSQVPEASFWEALPALRSRLGDRPVLRAIHIYEENRRALAQAACLEQGDFEGFLQLVRESGRSSALYLQNVTLPGAVAHQEMLLTLALCENALEGRGAVRVHGGGFGGTVEAFVPLDRTEQFRSRLESLLGPGSVLPLSLSPAGGVKVVNV